MVFMMEKTKETNHPALRIDLVKSRRGPWASLIQTPGASAAVTVPAKVALASRNLCPQTNKPFSTVTPRFPSCLLLP